MNHIKYFFYGLYLLLRGTIVSLVGLAVFVAGLLGMCKLLGLIMNTTTMVAMDNLLKWLAIFLMAFCLVMGSYALGKEWLPKKS